MEISVNGTKRVLAEGITAWQLLQQLKLKGPLALEVNRQLCPKRQHDQTILKEGDILEIVTIVGGG